MNTNYSDINQSVFERAFKKLPKRFLFEASRLFNKLDKNLKPQIIAIAIPQDNRKDFLIASTDDSNYPEEWFKKIKLIVNRIREDDITNLAFDVQGVLWQDKVNIENTLQELLNEKHLNSEFSVFSSHPDFMHGYCVCIILKFSKSSLESHYFLPFPSIRNKYTYTSLLYESINGFLSECTNALKALSKGQARLHLQNGGLEILREAGIWVMYKIGQITNAQVPAQLFPAFNVISSLKYEGSESLGKIILSTYDHPYLNIYLQFKEPIRIGDYKRTRKILEISSDDTHLLHGLDGIYGIGTIADPSNHTHIAPLFSVEFNSHHKWTLSHQNKSVMVVEYGQPRLPLKPINEHILHERIKNTFPQCKHEKLENLLQIINQASKQKHGTMIVISDQAESESIRLKNQSTQIEPILLTPNLILPLSSIDGAILISPNGICYSIGVILDGIATDKGDPSRGARFNSALRYLAYAQRQKHACLIVVISEDGMIDIF